MCGGLLNPGTEAFYALAIRESLEVIVDVSVIETGGQV
jgi:hypothetical protein